MRIAEVNGRQTYWIRQSWLSTAMRCLELGRREAFEGLESSDTDATILGTAGHVAVEHALVSLRDEGRYIDWTELVATALAEYERLAADPSVRWVQGDYADGVIFLKNMMRAWHREVYPQLSRRLLLEQPFDVPFFETEEVDVRLEGTIDCLDLHHGLIWDWKHKGREMQQWEEQRASVQATVYAHAAAQVGILTYPIRFNFTNALKRKRAEVIDIIPLQRTGHHALFLAAQVQDLIALHQSGLSTWPRVDQHVLCSQKFCPAWADCKGAYLTDETHRWRP